MSVGLLTWENMGNKYVSADGMLTELVSQRGNVMRVKPITGGDISYIVTDGNGRYAHGECLTEAREHLIYKINDRDTSAYLGIDLEMSRPFEECVVMYRKITGACAYGVRTFIEQKGIDKTDFSVQEISLLTKGAYGHEQFREFFSLD